MPAIVVITTAGTEEQANLLAQELVERRHSCCVNILPIQRSIYRWQGDICTDSEYMLVIKAREEEYGAIESAIKELHSYDLPEILAFNVSQGEEKFLQWLMSCGDTGASSRQDQDPPV